MPAPSPTLQQTLAASALATSLSADQVAVLATVVRLATFKSGDVLAREGAPDNHLYVVVDGQLGVMAQQGTAQENPIATLGPGDFAHELGFLDGTPRYATLVAGSDATVLVLEREGLEQLVDRDPRVAYGVMRAIVRAAHRNQTRLAVQGAELSNYVFKQHGRY